MKFLCDFSFFFFQSLEGEWERQQGEELLVQSQLKRVQEDLRRINRDIARGLKKKMTLEEKIGQRKNECTAKTCWCLKSKSSRHLPFLFHVRFPFLLSLP